QAFRNQAEQLGLTNTELLKQVVTTHLEQISHSQPARPKASLSGQQFADMYNKIFFQEDSDKEKEVVLEVRLRSDEGELIVPSIKIKSNTSIARICHSYAAYLADEENESEAEGKSAAEPQVVESMQIEYKDEVFLYKRYQNDYIELLSNAGEVIDTKDERYELLIQLYEKSTKD
ncbi:MAG: hypothetical protein AAFY48_18705, partial [Bacteroidota bacterium]